MCGRFPRGDNQALLKRKHPAVVAEDYLGLHSLPSNRLRRDAGRSAMSVSTLWLGTGVVQKEVGEE